MDNKHRKLFVNKQSKGCKFTPQCTKYVWRPGSDRTRWRGLCALPDGPDPLLLRGREEGRRGKRWRKGKGKESPQEKVKVSGINTDYVTNSTARHSLHFSLSHSLSHFILALFLPLLYYEYEYEYEYECHCICIFELATPCGRTNKRIRICRSCSSAAYSY